MDAARAQQAIGLVDLTDLGDDTTAEAVAALCERADRHGVAAVCVWPDFVAQAAAALSGSGVEVATVVNFPSGRERAHAVGVITEQALADGATEIDVVLPYEAFAAGDDDRAAVVLDRVADLCQGRAHVKVILETGELDDLALIARAARFAIDHGADFVKTSTGKSPVSATPAAAREMLHVIAAVDRQVGLKPSGGIRTAEDAETYLALAEDIMGAGWVSPATFRFGASSLLDALLEAAGE